MPFIFEKLKKSTLFSLFTVSAVFMSFNFSFSQTDSLHLKTGVLLVGELKEMKENVATFETDYSKNDFKIKWVEIKKIKTKTLYLVSLSSGVRYTGYLESIDDEEVGVIFKNDTLAKTKIKEIVFLRKLDQDFWSNLNASLSVGYNFTKANNLSQYSVRSNLGYRSKNWSASTSYNHIISSQQDVSKTQRLEANLVYKNYIKNKWFGLAEINWLSNTAQNINLRTLSKLGMGKYLVQTNSLYWGLQTGASFNNESFSLDGVDSSNDSAELFFGTEANLYDIGDLSFLSRVVVYPSLTESGRWRTDFNFDIKYDLPFDFYINFGLSYNYDNQPIQSGREKDYVFQTTLGWSL